MPRVVPTQIVMLMEDRFAAIVGVAQNVTAPMFHPWMRGIVTLIDRLPSELLPVKPSDFAELIFSVEVLRTVSEEAVARNFGSLERNAFREIHRILKACPDAAPAPDTADPAFIDDPDLRADLHRDLGEVNHALSNGEWKAATVLAGSVVEALLLWALQNRRTEAEIIRSAATRLGRKIDLRRRPLEAWNLSELIEYAEATEVITSETKAGADLGKDFRNLIHPGRAARLSKQCDRSTALFAVGAVEAVMANLARSLAIR